MGGWEAKMVATSQGWNIFFHFVDVPSVFMIIGRLGGGIWGHRSWQWEPGDQHLISPIFHSRKPTRYYYRGCGDHWRFGWRFSWLEVKTNLTNFSYLATRTRESKEVEVERTWKASFLRRTRFVVCMSLVPSPPQCSGLQIWFHGILAAVFIGQLPPPNFIMALVNLG